MSNDLRSALSLLANEAPTGDGLARSVLNADRHRRRTRTATAAGVALTAAATATVIALPSGGTGVAYAAVLADGQVLLAPSGDSCGTGFAQMTDPRSVPARLRPVLRMPDLSPSRPAFARSGWQDCASAARPLVLVQAGPNGDIGRSFLLTGPLPVAVQLGDGATPVRVRGVDGMEVTDSLGSTFVTWEEHGGQGWLVQGTGGSHAALLEDVNALQLDEHPRLPARAGASPWLDLGAVPAQPARATELSWSAAYRPAGGTGEDQVETSGGTTVGKGMTPGPGCRVTDVAGATAVACTNGEAWGSGLQVLQWRPDSGGMLEVQVIEHRFAPDNTPHMSDVERGDRVVQTLRDYANAVVWAVDNSREVQSAK